MILQKMTKTMILPKVVSFSKQNYCNIKKVISAHWHLRALEVIVCNFSLTFLFSLYLYSNYQVLCLGNLVSFFLNNICPIYAFFN